MSERRFVICDATEAVSTNKSINALHSITESELKRRVHDIRTIMYYNDDKAIDILLHGEGEKREELHNCKDTPKRVENDIYCDSCGKLLVEYNNVEQDQPSPTHTRAEWEAWADSVSKIIWWSNADGPTVKKALLSMPIVPKEVIE